jgi:hypothetical protein
MSRKQKPVVITQPVVATVEPPVAGYNPERIETKLDELVERYKANMRPKVIELPEVSSTAKPLVDDLQRGIDVVNDDIDIIEGPSIRMYWLIFVQRVSDIFTSLLQAIRRVLFTVIIPSIFIIVGIAIITALAINGALGFVLEYDFGGQTYTIMGLQVTMLEIIAMGVVGAIVVLAGLSCWVLIANLNTTKQNEQ